MYYKKQKITLAFISYLLKKIISIKGGKYKRARICCLWLPWGNTGWRNFSSLGSRRCIWGCNLERKAVSEICRACACSNILWHSYDQCREAEGSFGVLQSLCTNIFKKSNVDVWSFKANGILQGCWKEIRKNTWGGSTSRATVYTCAGNIC